MSIHTCGLYFSVPLDGRLDKHYLPQVNIKAHAHILSTVSRTTITQTFTNPSSTKGIRSARYVFPLYDGVSVVGFECRIGDRLIIGEVKEKEKAKAEYSQAVDRGEVAALFEQIPDASDCFTTTVGNIPPDTQAVVTITYLGELKHDMEVDGIRYTIPTRIFPRYGPLPDLFREKKDFSALGMGISITVDAEVAAGSFIQKISSPSHPIAVTMGTTSLAPNDDHSPTKASASLSLDKTSLETDFVLQIVAKDSGIPRAILENHPTVSDHRALMATLVPKFALPSERPEVVFVCDRSGSMGGTRITLAIQALKVLLKSLPVGVKFNICSFGSRYSFLWEKSATYSQQTLDESMNHINSFAANYGGTELRQPLEATIANRYKDIPLEIIMLTDGEAWRQGALFAFLNEEITVKNSPIRIFPLGIGTGVSHAFIEGVARAGNGFSQAVGEGEKMDAKVVRMLKGALSPHINDYTLEIKYSEYSGLDSSDDGFELIEKVADALNVQLNLSEQGPKEKQTEPQKPISLFNQSADPDKEPTPPLSPTGQSKYSYLPNVAVPKIIQAPQKIPSLFAFNRTTVYLLLGPDAPQATPKSVILRGTSSYGPLELEIPIQMLESPDEMIHQLAAKKAIAELEQGRGWLPEARDKESGNLIKAQYESRFSDMVEREAVRLGVQFQVGGKWCSFVALEKKSAEESDEAMSEDYECLDDDAAETTRATTSSPKGADSFVRRQMIPNPHQGLALWASSNAVSPLPPISGSPGPLLPAAQCRPASHMMSSTFSAPVMPRGQLQQAQMQPQMSANFSAPVMPPPAPPILPPPLYSGAGTKNLQYYKMQMAQLQGTDQDSGLAPSPDFVQDWQAQRMLLMQTRDERLRRDGHMIQAPVDVQAASRVTDEKKKRNAGASARFRQRRLEKEALSGSQGGEGSDPSTGRFRQRRKKLPTASEPLADNQALTPNTATDVEMSTNITQKKLETEDEILDAIIELQTFSGSWNLSKDLLEMLNITDDYARATMAELGIGDDVAATAFVVAFLENKMQKKSDVWELVVEKARLWLKEHGLTSWSSKFSV